MPAFATEMVCCSMASWIATRSDSRICHTGGAKQQGKQKRRARSVRRQARFARSVAVFSKYKRNQQQGGGYINGCQKHDGKRRGFLMPTLLRYDYIAPKRCVQPLWPSSFAPCVVQSCHFASYMQRIVENHTKNNTSRSKHET